MPLTLGSSHGLGDAAFLEGELMLGDYAYAGDFGPDDVFVL
jgi:hypothetical protein